MFGVDRLNVERIWLCPYGYCLCVYVRVCVCVCLSVWMRLSIGGSGSGYVVVMESVLVVRIFALDHGSWINGCE